jgi:hypothetical protein
VVADPLNVRRPQLALAFAVIVLAAQTALDIDFRSRYGSVSSMKYHKHLCFMCRAAYEDSISCPGDDKDHVWGVCGACEVKSLVLNDDSSRPDAATPTRSKHA